MRKLIRKILKNIARAVRVILFADCKRRTVIKAKSEGLIKNSVFRKLKLPNHLVKAILGYNRHVTFSISQDSLLFFEMPRVKIRKTDYSDKPLLCLYRAF